MQFQRPSACLGNAQGRFQHWAQASEIFKMLVWSCRTVVLLFSHSIDPSRKLIVPLGKRTNSDKLAKRPKPHTFRADGLGGFLQMDAVQAKGALSVGTLNAASLSLQCRLTILKNTFPSGWIYFSNLSMFLKLGTY